MVDLPETALRARLNLSFDEAIEKTRAALQTQGFGVLTEVDVQATLKKKLDVDFRKYIILGVCNPPLAHRAFQTQLEIGLLLPCNVIVYEDGAQTIVSIVDPLGMLQLLKNPAMDAVAHEAYEKLVDVMLSLRGMTVY